MYFYHEKKDKYMNSDDKLFLLDAYALIYRAYYAFIKSPRINSNPEKSVISRPYTISS